MKCALAGFAALALMLSAGAPGVEDGDHAAGYALIRAEDIKAHATYLASPQLEGRDSPSRGLSLAARYISDRLSELGIAYTKDSQKAFRSKSKAYRPWLEEEKAKGDGKSRAKKGGTYLRPWTRPVVSPVPKKCTLKLIKPSQQFEYGRDFVPIAGADGKANGELVFCGYGIRSKKDDYDDLEGLTLSGRVALLFEGEPEDRSKFEGTQVSEFASLWDKVDTLAKKNVSGILVVRHIEPGKDAEPIAGPAYRFSQAIFNGDRKRDLPPRNLPPMLVISEECATALLGSDAKELRESIDESVTPAPRDLEGKRVSLKVKTELMDTALDNVVGILRGSDAKLANQYIVIGAHYDHIGAGPRGRTGLGADDNASGTSALLELVEALVESKPRRSILFAFFSGEEDGLLGSKALCRDLPIDKKQIVAMVNLDMIGRGPTSKVAVLGLKQNPKLEELVERANALTETGVTEIEVCKDDSLFQRSDHYSFHSMLGVPTVFFLENYPVERNPDYHTWRDTLDKLNVEKVTNTAKLAFNTAWLLANEDGRPPRPKF